MDDDEYLKLARKFGHYGRRTIWRDMLAAGYTGPIPGFTLHINGAPVRTPDISEESLRAEAEALGIPWETP